MKYKLQELLPSLFATVLILVILDIITTSFFPSIGILRYKIPFSILIVLFIGFKIDTPWLPVIILIIQLVHSVFTVEGWAYGTFVGVLVCLVINYAKEILDFSNPLSTMVIVQIFQLIWFILLTLLICLKVGSYDAFFPRFFSFIPGSIVLSLISPFFFKIFEKIWKIPANHMGV